MPTEISPALREVIRVQHLESAIGQMTVYLCASQPNVATSLGFAALGPRSLRTALGRSHSSTLRAGADMVDVISASVPKAIDGIKDMGLSAAQGEVLLLPTALSQYLDQMQPEVASLVYLEGSDQDQT